MFLDVSEEELQQVGDWWKDHTPEERTRAFWGPQLTKKGAPLRRPSVSNVARFDWNELPEEQRAHIVVGFRKHGPFFPVVRLTPLQITQ